MKLFNHISQCSSTNDEIISLWEQNPRDFLTLYTFHQTNGRGQYGNTWEIQPNQNLAFSFALLEENIQIPFQLFNFHTANILRDFIAKKTETEVQIKWPNDIILRNKKISGMLIERKKVAGKIIYIIGVGINILQENFAHLPKAGSVFTQTGLSFDLTEWAEEMHEYLVQNILVFPTEAGILQEYHSHLFRRGQVSVFNIKGMRQNGIIQRVDSEGFLWVELENEGLKKFFHKEIELEY